MKKSLSMISSALLLSAMLAACNTDTDQPTTTSANETTETESTETDNTTVEETTTNEQTDEHAEQTSFDNENTSAPTEETTLTYTSNGQEITEKAVTSTSDELGYSISHLENYTLESEEPGVDHLFYNDDNTLSMQIKVASTDETTSEDTQASTKETIAAIASEDNYNEIDLANVKESTSDDIKTMIGYETVIDSDKITIVTFEKGSKIITLTIYDTEEANLTDAFLHMGLTIQ